jgi:hypothetical protein
VFIFPTGSRSSSGIRSCYQCSYSSQVPVVPLGYGAVTSVHLYHVLPPRLVSKTKHQDKPSVLFAANFKNLGISATDLSNVRDETENRLNSRNGTNRNQNFICVCVKLKEEF